MLALLLRLLRCAEFPGLCERYDATLLNEMSGWTMPQLSTCRVIVCDTRPVGRIDMAISSVPESAQEVLRRVDALSRGVIGCDPTGLNGVESPIAGLVRAVTPLVLDDARPEAGGASFSAHAPVATLRHFVVLRCLSVAVCLPAPGACMA